jgi:hypothetical protein
VKFKEECFDSFVNRRFGVDCDGLFGGHDVNHWMAKLRGGAIVFVTCCDEQVLAGIRDATGHLTIVEGSKVKWSGDELVFLREVYPFSERYQVACLGVVR